MSRVYEMKNQISRMDELLRQQKETTKKLEALAKVVEQKKQEQEPSKEKKRRKTLTNQRKRGKGKDQGYEK